MPIDFAGSPDGPGGFPPHNRTRLAVARLILADLGRGSYMDDPMTRFVVAWQAHESTGRDASLNNPLKSTQKSPGSHAWSGSSIPIQVYPNLDEAVAAYVANLKTPLYAKLRAELVSGTPATAAQALQQSGWCGGPRAPCPGYGQRILATAIGYGSGDTPSYRVAALTPAGVVGLNTVPNANGRSQVGGDAGQAKEWDPFGLSGFLDAVGKIARWLLDPDNWVRMGQVAGGAALVLVGIALVKHDTLAQALSSIPTPQTMAAGAALKVAS